MRQDIEASVIGGLLIGGLTPTASDVLVYDENSSAAPFAEIIVTKNRFGSLGTVYQRFCNGHFVACDQDEARQICTASNAPAARGRRYAQGADV